MLVAKSHEIRSDDGVIRGFKTRCGKRAGNKNTGGWIGVWRRTVRMQRAAVVFGRSVLVSSCTRKVRAVQRAKTLRACSSYRLGGSCLFRALETFSGSNAAVSESGRRPGESEVESMRSVAGSSGAATTASVAIVLRDWKHWLHIEGRDKERHVRAMRKVSSLLTILLSQKLFSGSNIRSSARNL